MAPRLHKNDLRPEQVKRCENKDGKCQNKDGKCQNKDEKCQNKDGKCQNKDGRCQISDAFVGRQSVINPRKKPNCVR